jgi:hypothetical protein
VQNVNSPTDTSRELLLLCGLFFAAGIVVITWYPVNHDAAWLLHVAGRWLDGARLYVDVIEVNPPLIIMLLAPVVALGRLLRLWEVTAFYLAVFCLAAVSLWLCRRALATFMSARRISFMIVTLAAAFLFLPRVEFGQREHLMFIFAAPYFITVAARSMGVALPRSLALAAGALGGVGLALKPYFLFALVALEAYLSFRHRRWIVRRPELAAIVAVGLVYLIALLAFASAYIDVARWGMDVYGAFYPSTWQTIAREPGTFLAISCVAAAAFTRKWHLAGLRHTFAIATVVFTIVVFIQNKNWDYHWLPVWSAASVVWVSLIMEAAAARVRIRSFRRAALWVVSVVLIAVGLFDGSRASAREWARLEYAYRFSSVLSIIERTEGATDWFAFSSSMPTAFPVVTYTGLRWSARFNSLWPLVGIYEETPPSTRDFPYNSIDQMGPVERFMFESTIQDLLRSRPSLILVDLTPPGARLYGFDYMKYFAADERFVDFMSGYGLLADLGPYRILAPIE